MNSEQTRIVKEIMDNKDIYLYMAGEKRNYLQNKYDSFTPLFQDYYTKLLNEAVSRGAYVKTLDTKKIDPYIAGGAAHGVAGLGAGLYAASEAAEKNREIDALRSYYKDQVFNDASVRSESEKKLLKEAKEIDAILDSIEPIMIYREEQVEKVYQDAKKLMKGSSTNSLQARNVLLSLGDYKDSAILAEECIQYNNRSLIKEVCIVSAIVSAVIGLCGGLACGLEGYTTVFCCCFLVCLFLFGGIAYKNRIK